MKRACDDDNHDDDSDKHDDKHGKHEEPKHDDKQDEHDKHDKHEVDKHDDNHESTGSGSAGSGSGSAAVAVFPVAGWSQPMGQYFDLEAHLRNPRSHEGRLGEPTRHCRVCRLLLPFALPR